MNACILNTAGVTKLVSSSFNLNRNTRVLNISYTIETVYTQLSTNSNQVSATTSFLLTESGQIITTESGQQISTGG